MELDAGADLGELRLGRLEQANPDERLGVVDAPITLADPQLTRSTYAVFVEGAVDDHHAIVALARARAGLDPGWPRCRPDQCCPWRAITAAHNSPVGGESHRQR